MDYKNFLQQYADLQAEMKDLENRIRKLEALKDKLVHDSVTGSDSEFPYIKKRFHIHGLDEKRRSRLSRLKNLLAKRKEKCEEMKLQIEEFISTIPDSRTRRVFQYRYIDDLTWQAIAMRLGKVHDSYPRRDIHDKYLENL